MDGQGVGKVCLALRGVTVEHPFDQTHDAYKVGGKMFAEVGGMGGLSFKVSDIAYEVLTETGRARPAPYLAHHKWVHLADPAEWPDEELTDHLRIAHLIVAATLSKRRRAELGLR
ncbi:hypothetical protein ASG17_12465 [Brevundimonas sp. Leaf363]|uniref:MmcQ/YjbR family DNA-binding protein n=1 Tax=Brevundimonas sp. Leaf363 TaxID=1736353 RepID=UPI0006F81AE9|nr:MmcQ/YjbR family DNA-binding protein [Brevundimonas sp. Leaf363]KQS54434.1 hypothetical protein ASG17_12465 [Brevundimonas sp. Leaf363]